MDLSLVQCMRMYEKGVLVMKLQEVYSEKKRREKDAPQILETSALVRKQL